MSATTRTVLREWILQEDIPKKMAKLCNNPHPAAIALATSDMSGIGWRRLSKNPCPGAVALLALNQHKIRWRELSGNPCPAAITLLALYPAKIHWSKLSYNTCPAAMKVLKKNYDKINWAGLLQMPYIFKEVYDYPAIRARMDLLREDFAREVGHPLRLERHLEAGCDPDDF